MLIFSIATNVVYIHSVLDDGSVSIRYFVVIMLIVSIKMMKVAYF
jgi:hypothetical protein